MSTYEQKDPFLNDIRNIFTIWQYAPLISILDVCGLKSIFYVLGVPIPPTCVPPIGPLTAWAEITRIRSDTV